MLSLRERITFALPHVAVVRLRGTIGRTLEADRYTRFFSGLLRIPTTRAVVLDWDSPGGSVSDSEALTDAVKHLAQHRPVVSHIGSVGASGAYMAAIAAHKVTATATALVGSIGVISLRPQLAGLFDRIGVGIEVTKSGPFKDSGAFWRAPTEDERDREAELVKDLSDDFSSWVAEARKLSPNELAAVTTGEVWTGRRAGTLKLIDEVAGRARAIEIAAELAGIPPRTIELGPRRTLLEQLNPAAVAIDLTRTLGAAFARGFTDTIEAGARPGGSLRA